MVSLARILSITKKKENEIINTIGNFEHLRHLQMRTMDLLTKLSIDLKLPFRDLRTLSETKLTGENIGKERMRMDLISRYKNATEEILKLYYHPVHFYHEENHQYYPTALVPFCQFGADMSETGRNSSLFSVPVCDVFKEKVINDQLCYQVDLNKFQANKTEKQRRLNFRDGLFLIIDINEEYQTDGYEILTKTTEENSAASLQSEYADTGEDKNFMIYIETISKMLVKKGGGVSFKSGNFFSKISLKGPKIQRFLSHQFLSVQ